MKKLLFIFLVGCTMSKTQDKGLSQYSEYFKGEAANWTATFIKFNLSEFKKVDTTIQFENRQDKDFKGLPSFLETYQPIITFNKDSSQFVDIYSYQLGLEPDGKNTYKANVEVDEAIYLCNTKTKSWRIIDFKGPTSYTEEVIWVSNTKFFLLGVQKDDAFKNTPVILLGDTDKQTFELFLNTNKDCVQIGKGYSSKKLERLKINNL
jgi:hypothetical protein